MHGSSVEADEWFHGDDLVSHIDLGDWYLRQAIKHTVANDGHEGILQELIWRQALAARLDKYEQTRESGEPESS